MAKAVALDHVVLHVADPRRSIEWYRDRLGLEPVRVHEWEAGEVLFPSLRIDESTVIDLLEAERTGENVNHVCLVLEPTDLDELAGSGDFETQGPPVELWGARGMGRGLYVKDPDGNTIELRTYE
jgi:catechol 2,3-dioxygenase-like lactoylglutathione lyase family enzyme